MSRRLLVVLVLAGLGWLLLPVPVSSSPTTHHISIDMTQFAFSPSRVEVSQGDHLVIDLTASDVVHGFYLDGYGIEQRVEPGLTRQITLIADKTGKFRFRCSVSCGELHPFIQELMDIAMLPTWKPPQGTGSSGSEDGDPEPDPDGGGQGSNGHQNHGQLVPTGNRGIMTCVDAGEDHRVAVTDIIPVALEWKNPV